MKSNKVKLKNEKSISKMADEVTRVKMRMVTCNRKLTDKGRQLAKLLDCALSDEKVDEWGTTA